MLQTPLHRETLAEQLAAQLACSISEQKLAPGDALPPEGKLAAEFGVSRPIMREALRILETRGIIQVTGGKGATIRPMTSEPLRGFFTWALQFHGGTSVEVMEIRRGIEVYAAALAAERATDAERDEMRHIIVAMREHLHHPDAYTELNYRLHLLIAAATHNQMMCHLWESLREPLREMNERKPRLPRARDTDDIQDAHENIVAAIERHDAAAASAAMAMHLEAAIRSARGASGGPCADHGAEEME